MGLATYDQVKAVLPAVLARAKATDNTRMPPPPNRALLADELQVLERYQAAGAQRSDEVCQPSPPTGLPTLDCKADRTIAPASRFTMPKDKQDLYVCYGVTLTESQKRHITGIAARIDNTTIAHHMLLLESPSPVSSTPFACDSGMSAAWRMVYGWAPGSQPLALPAEAGFPLEGSKHYVVQMHYNNARALEGETDASGLDLCTTAELRPNDADIMAFGTLRFNIPARGKLTRNCSVEVPPAFAGKTFFAAMPHMHNHGTSIATTLERGNDKIDMGTVPQWDFNTQYWLPITGATARAGDKIRTICSWENKTNDAVQYGSGTADEMCYSFTMYYPRITGLFSWEVPAATSSCQ
jgi:hypothetical protein